MSLGWIACAVLRFALKRFVHRKHCTDGDPSVGAETDSEKHKMDHERPKSMDTNDVNDIEFERVPNAVCE